MRSRRAIEQLRMRRAGVIGTVAIAITLMIAYTAYNALNGLPLESRYRINVVLPDADHLIAADNVKIGGVRVGQVAKVDATPPTSSTPPTALVRLSLDPSVAPLPTDTAVRVRSASPLGATYVEILPGKASTTIEEGGTLRPARPPRTPNLVDLYDLFDRPARGNFRRAVREISGGLTGRGGALNATFASLSTLLPHLGNVSSVLAAPPTRLGRFIRVYGRLVDALAPISPQLTELMANGATTMGALGRERAALGQTIDLVPSTEAAATDAMRAVRPGLDRLARLTSALDPATRTLPAALSALDSTIRTGTPVLRSSGRLTGPLRTTAQAITTVARQRATDGTVRKLAELFTATDEVLDVLLPAQTQCNLIPLFFQQFASYVGMIGVGNGPSLINVAVDRLGASNEQAQSAAPAPDLHVNYLPNENTDECEAGNEPFVDGEQRFTNAPGLQSARTRESTPPPHVLDLARSAGLLTGGGTGR